MLTFHSPEISPASRYLHLLGCLLGTALIVLFVAFALGAGPPPFGTGSAALLAMLTGFLLAWWYGVYGGIVSLIGIAAFYVWNFAASGHFPGGWVYSLCFLPGALQLTAWFVRRPTLRVASK
jgi:hypothetical protein